MSAIESMSLTSLTQELTVNHEQYFRSNVLLNMYPIFCGDERPTEFPGLYIHVFGGVANPAFNNEVIARTKGIVTGDTFKTAVGASAHTLIDKGIEAGVHSDNHAETGNTMSTEGDNPIGCGYIKLRQPISHIIAADPDKIIAKAEQLDPGLFTDPSDSHFAHQVVAAHAQLAADADFFASSSRQVAAGAIEAGAPAMLVLGDHGAKAGIISKIPETTIDSNAANEDNEAIFVHDSWAALDMLDMMPNAEQSSSRREREIADLIDAIGTMWALGVEEITVRR